MACATVDFTNFQGFAAAGFPNVSRFQDDQFYFEPEISSEHGFEDIVSVRRHTWSRGSGTFIAHSAEAGRPRG